MNYLQAMPDYARRLLWRMDTFCGILIGLIFFIIAVVAGLSQNVTVIVTLAIIVASGMEAGYGLYREERMMRAEREQELWIDARIIKFSGNVPDPGPEKTSMTLTVLCEVWTSIDATTSNVGLNIIWGYRNHWWELWKNDRVYKEGLPPKPETSTEFRKSLRAVDPQPIRWQFDFEYVTDRFVKGNPHWFLELVVKTGIPPGTHRIPISLQDSLGPRVTNPPL